MAKTPHERLARAAQAQALLGDDMLGNAFKSLEHEYLKAWGATTAPETGARENLWRAIQILGDVRRHLDSFVKDGRVAQHEIDKLSGVNRAA